MTNSSGVNLCRIIFNLTHNTGGSSVHCLELSRQIDSHLNQQFIITAKPDRNVFNMHDTYPFKIYNVGYLRCQLLARIKSRFLPGLPVAPFIRFSFGISAVFKCFELNKLYGIDIIQIHGIGNAIVTTFLKHLIHKPTVLMLHGSLGSYSNLSDMYESLIMKMTAFDHYFILDHGGTILSKAYKILRNKSCFDIVPVNIDITKYRPKKPDTQIIRNLSINGKFVFVSVHSLEPVQGVKFTIKAFGLFIKKYSVANAVLLIIGDGSLKQNLKYLANEMNLAQNILFIGRVMPNTIPNYFSIAHVALSTSPSVNMNRSTHEAMACRKSVIVFNSGNTTDQLIKHRETGILVPNYQVDKLADAMYLLYSNSSLRTKLGMNARAFIETNRTWDKRINMELNVYKKLLRRKCK